MRANHRIGFICGAIGIAVGCSKASAPGQGKKPGETQLEPGVAVALSLSPTQSAEQGALTTALSGVAGLTPSSFASKYATKFATSLGYDPSSAKGLELIQASPLQLTAAELAAYSAHGFVISESKRYPTFAHGYETIYSRDLPVYVSADSILEAVHRSYDSLLEQIESTSLIPDLRSMLGAMRGVLATAPADQASADADVYLAVALSLLQNSAAAPVRGGDTAQIGSLFAKGSAHEGTANIVLFGVSRNDEDFSQFTPRGHYTDTPELTRYFQAMMWLGRIDFRFIDTQEDGSQVFRRRQVEAALRLRDLLDTSSRQSWSHIDATIQAFVGEADYMTVPQLDSLLKDLGVTTAAELSAVPDNRIAQAIVDGGYGTQRISSHIMINGLGNKTLPLSSSFALMGQRYVVDSHVFSNVVYDRIGGRYMPDPLDAAFAALGNDQAGILLKDQIEKYDYATALASMRVLVDQYGDDAWHENLYNLWLSADRALSPGAELADPAQAGLSAPFATETWGRRLLNAQLASWAELRHDTILYAKQSYSGGVVCDFPDAYVDPYPKFYQALRMLADRGSSLMGQLGLSDPNLANVAQSYFTTLAKVMDTLGQMAQAERTGTPFTAEQMAFINQAIHFQGGCGSTAFDGWYAQIYLSSDSGGVYDPTIADVHTQPFDESGNEVGRVLHVGTGLPRLMVVSVDTCQGPRAYAGLASTYFEQVTENYERLTDEKWSAQIIQTTPDDVRWMKDVVVR